jgi:hypothetical protein
VNAQLGFVHLHADAHFCQCELSGIGWRERHATIEDSRHRGVAQW